MKKYIFFILSLCLAVKGYTQCQSVIYSSNINVNNDENTCGAVVNYVTPFILDTCTLVGFFEDFELGYSGWTKGSYNTLINWAVQNETGVGTPLNSNMFGVPHSGNYAFGGKEYSYIQSPVFSTVGGGEFSFDFFVNNEPAVHDQEIVEISFDGGITWNFLVENQLPNNEFSVQSTSFPISASDGSVTTIVRFTYNTVDACCGAQDGFFIDNVRFEKNNTSTIQLLSGLGSGSIFPIGNTTEVYQVSDGVNNDTISFSVTVNSTHHSTQTLSICFGESISVGPNIYTTTGLYYDTLSTSFGCDSVVTTNLLVKNSIDTTLFIDDRLIMSNEVNASYQWLSCTITNTPINGANDREFIANENGNYAVVISKEGCEKISTSVTIMSVGVDELKNNNGVLVYPNPFVDNIKLVFDKLENNASISIYDVSGKELYHYNKINTLTTKLDLSSFSSGIYFVRSNNGEEQQLIKLIKQ